MEIERHRAIDRDKERERQIERDYGELHRYHGINDQTFTITHTITQNQNKHINMRDQTHSDTHKTANLRFTYPLNVGAFR